MGWSGGYDSKAAVVEHLKRQIGDRLLRAQVVGRVLWTAEKTHLEPGSFIGCYLLSGGRFHDGVRLPPGSDLRWGYKDVCESMGIFEVSCPLSFLDLVPQPSGEYAGPWRERVRAYHAERAGQARVVKAAKVGDSVELVAGYRPAVVVVTAIRGRSIVGSFNGLRYKVPSRLVARVIPPAGEAQASA
jgi:hypothetical protein